MATGSNTWSHSQSPVFPEGPVQMPPSYHLPPHLSCPLAWRACWWESELWRNLWLKILNCTEPQFSSPARGGDDGACLLTFVVGVKGTVCVMRSAQWLAQSMFLMNISYNDFLNLITASGKLLGAGTLQDSDLGSDCQGWRKCWVCFQRTVQCLPWASSFQAEWTWTGHRPEFGY